ncbi:glycoside hydrolase family 3 protein [Dipodascopsis tothii]|uniref:glycoside hydrolase family 3 protein n=1 Tax=Dipodascopsis tothii TaxID=44089 RepID=UPI0034CD1CC4
MNQLNIEETIEQLTLKEKVSLLSGVDFWHTASVPRLNVPAMRFTDGPNGVRGTRFFRGVPAACFPCGTAMAATFDQDLMVQAGELMGHEALAKGAHVILGPTVNMQRSPIGGRGFESFSEDPVLAGVIAGAVIRGIESTGVSATIKHYVCNDQEEKRMASNSIVGQRALREIYLLPFQIAIREGMPSALMTAYNKVNGVHAANSEFLLKDVLRKEWGWNGLVMSDWFGCYTTAESINAGMAIDMPGPTGFRGQLVERAMGAGLITASTVNQRVREVLTLVNRAIATGVPENAPEEGRDCPETSALLRKIGAASVVVLKNDAGVLPLKTDKTVAVIGPNAKFAAYCGGGSASLTPYYAITPFDGIAAKFADVKYVKGCDGHKLLPPIGGDFVAADGTTGMHCQVFLEPPSVADRKPIDTFSVTKLDMLLVDYKHPKITPESTFYITSEGSFVPEETGDYQFGVSVYGTAKLFIDDKLVVDNDTKQVRGSSFFGAGTVEETGTATLTAGTSYKVKLEFGSSNSCKLVDPNGGTQFDNGGVKVGMVRVLDPAIEIANAAAVAATVDQVVLCIGLNLDWESEGYDRSNMDLPPHTNELVAAVVKANPNTVVVVQSGTPVEMPWASDVSTLVQAWYGGNETGNAIADVLVGDVNPSGRLPLTFPVKVQDNPAYLNTACDVRDVVYGEGIHIGYRYYQKAGRAPLFYFGEGLSYTSFGISDLKLAQADGSVELTFTAGNTGALDGAEVFLFYVSQKAPGADRPVRELKAFKKVEIAAGKSTAVSQTLSIPHATSYWSLDEDSWISEKDTYTVTVVSTSSQTELAASFTTTSQLLWRGL